MFWFVITIISYFLNSLSLLINKFLLEEKIKNPAVYTFFTCSLLLIAVILLPFDWQQPSIYELLIELLAGFLFGIAIWLMFIALKKGETSRVIPIIGGVQPLIILPLAWYWLGEKIPTSFLIALFLIIFGTFLISYEKKQVSKIPKQVYFLAVFSAVFFALSVIATKAAFNSQNSFITPFVISRFGAFFWGLLLLLNPTNWKSLLNELSQPKMQTNFLFIFSQVLGGLSSILINLAFAISSGVTAVINALQGLQYVFLLMGVVILSKFFPKILQEKLDIITLIQKSFATTLIIIGIIILSF